MVKLQAIFVDKSSRDTKKGFSILVLVLLALLVTFSPLASAGKIVKWKDDQGVTHYGDHMPAQYSSRESTELNKRGIAVKRSRVINAQEQADEVANQEQDKKNKALLNMFTSAEEIDLARDRNLQLDLVAVDSLQIQKKNSLKRLTDNQRYAAELTQKKKPVPADLSAEMTKNQAEIDKQEQQINERKAVMESTRKRFDDDKARFNLLKNNTGVSNATLEVKPLVSPAPITNEPVKVPENSANGSKR